VIVVLLVYSESVALGYRFFIATDAALADIKEMVYGAKILMYRLDRSYRKN
jgi:hypothetical protein